MKTDIKITQKKSHKSIKLLEAILSNEMMLYVKTRKFHWHVFGESFMELHKLFQSQYTQLEDIIDLAEERINKLGGKTIVPLKELSQFTLLMESPDIYPSQNGMMKELLKDYELLIQLLRKDIDECTKKIKDAVTTDFLTVTLQQHQSAAWELRRYVS